MNTTHKIKNALVSAAVAGGIAVTGAVVAPPAHAEMGSATVRLYWTGANCIQVQMISGRYEWACGGMAEYNNYNAYDGTQTGVNPIMGDANYITCDFYIDGVLKYTDSAYAGDGTDVNCLRTVHYYGVQNGYAI